MSGATFSFHRCCAVQHPKPQNKTKWLFWKSFVYFIYSSKIWQALLKYQDNINIHLRTPNNHPEEQLMGKWERSRRMYVERRPFLDIQKRSNLEPTVQFALISSWKLPIFFDISGYLAPGCRHILQIYQAVPTFCNDTNLEKSHGMDQWNWILFCLNNHVMSSWINLWNVASNYQSTGGVSNLENPQFFPKMGKKTTDRAHPCTKSFNKPLMTFRKNFPLKQCFFFNWVLLDILMNFLWNHMGLDQVMGEICRICFINRFSLDHKSRRKWTVKLMMQFRLWDTNIDPMKRLSHSLPPPSNYFSRPMRVLGDVE